MTSRTHDDLRSYFDALAEASESDAVAVGYTTADGNDDIIFDPLASEIRELLRLTPSCELLDIGCGTGALLQRLAPFASQATGLDLSSVAIDRCRQKGLSAVEYDGGALPFPAESYDRVLMFSMLINYPWQKEASEMILDALRLLRPGGYLLVGNVPRADPRFEPSQWEEPFRARILQRLRRTLGQAPRASAGCYSYPFSFFAQVADKAACRELLIVPAKIDRPGWEIKYHVLLGR